MNLLFSTTQGHNPGDDFIRWGIRSLMPEHNAMFFNRAPQSRYTHNNAWLEHLDVIDYVVLAGTPELLDHNIPLMQQCIKIGKPLLIIGLGSHVYSGTPGIINSALDQVIPKSDEQKLVRDLVPLTIVCTVRDSLMQRALLILGHAPVLFPCPSFYAVGNSPLSGPEPYVGFVYKNILRETPDGLRGLPWAGMIEQASQMIVAKLIGLNYMVLVICHYLDDFVQARDLFRKSVSSEQIVYSSEAADFLRVYRGLSLVVSIRVHGACLAASMGRPAVHLGYDSRMETVKHCGQIAFDVRRYRDPSSLAESVIEAFQARSLAEWSKSLLHLKEQTGLAYRKLIEDKLSGPKGKPDGT